MRKKFHWLLVIILLIVIISGTIWVVNLRKKADNIHNFNSSLLRNNSNKAEIKIFFGGYNLTNLNYYVFIDSKKYPNEMPEEYYYYIRKNHPTLAGKRIDQEGLVLTLSFDEKEIVKRKVKGIFDKNSPDFGFGGTFLEKGFSLTPNIPWDDWPGGFENLKTEVVYFVNSAAKEGNAIFRHSDPKKDTRYLVNVDNPAIKKGINI